MVWRCQPLARRSFVGLFTLVRVDAQSILAMDDGIVYGRSGQVNDAKAALVDRRLMADLRQPALGTVRPEAASQDACLSVSKVASNSSDGVPGTGQKKTDDSRP